MRFCHKSWTQNFRLGFFETFQLWNKRCLFFDKRGHWIARDWAASDQRWGRKVVVRATYNVLLLPTYQTLKFNDLFFVLHVLFHVNQVLRKPSVFLQMICTLLYNASCQLVLLDIWWRKLSICLICRWVHLHHWTGWSEPNVFSRPVMESNHILILFFLSGFFCQFNYWIRISFSLKLKVIACVFKIGDVWISFCVLNSLFMTYWGKCCFSCLFYWNSICGCDIWQGICVLVASWSHIQRGYWIYLIKLFHKSI